MGTNGSSTTANGGSVTPEHAGALLSDSDVDGLGTSRWGRDPVAFVEIVRQIVALRGR